MNPKYSVGTILKNHTTGSKIVIVSVTKHPTKPTFRYDLMSGEVYLESTLTNLYKVISTKEGYDSNVKSKYRF